MKTHARARLALLGLIVAAGRGLPAQSATSQFVIDARAAPPAVETGFFRMGTSTSPTGHTIGATSRYLTRDSRPWLPVMGEFHFARYPEQFWSEEIAKMKADGLQIVASYVFWIHHEEVEGQYDWSGQRSLRRFLEICQQNGLLAFVRIGPWSHGEARNGGFPDWLVRKVASNLRSNDFTYLAHVTRFYGQIAQQLRGMLWKDGGPVIGIQFENEYNGRGPGRGEEHILELKRIARAAGMDVPLYTVTGWDNAVLPAQEVIPVFGGYPDWPWDQSIELMPPNEVYAFRFENRWSGSMRAHDAPDKLNPTSQQALARYPFLGAEYAGGIQITYHRRPVIEASDIAAMLPVQLGSGVNLYGYYMFHGGTNPSGKLSTLQESQRTGYPTDVPLKSYDFQAALGESGEMRESFRKIKLVHYFLNEFGSDLAPMVVRRPSVVPANQLDTTVLRLSARTLRSRGYLFVSNYVRDYAMPVRKNVQVMVRLPSGAVRVPSSPIDVPSGASFIWPLNFDLNGATLAYSTAQLLTRVTGTGTPVYFFFAIPGITPEFAFEAMSITKLEAAGATTTRAAGRIYVRALQPGTNAAITLRSRTGASARVVLLSQAQAENAWRFSVNGTEQLALSPQDVFVADNDLHLRSRGQSEFALAVFPALPPTSGLLQSDGTEGIFTRYRTALPQRVVPATVTNERMADPAPPVRKFNAVSWRKVEIALAPSDSAFEGAARWRITLPPTALDSGDVFLEVKYQGDVARLYSGGELLTDNFFNGTPWVVGLKRYADAIRRGPLELRILPLRSDAPIFIQPQYRPRSFPASGQLAELQSVQAFPEYELIIKGACQRRSPQRC